MKDKISGIFLLFSLVLSNYIDSTLGKRVNKIIQNNYAAKLAIVYILIYFTINFTSSDNNHIIEHFQNTTMIFILYILFTKINLYISLFHIHFFYHPTTFPCSFLSHHYCYILFPHSLLYFYSHLKNILHKNVPQPI